jgi:methyltransferase-like protein
VEDGGKNIGFSVEHSKEELEDEDGDDIPVDEQFYYVGERAYRVSMRLKKM